MTQCIFYRLNSFIKCHAKVCTHCSAEIPTKVMWRGLLFYQYVSQTGEKTDGLPAVRVYPRDGWGGRACLRDGVGGEPARGRRVPRCSLLGKQTAYNSDCTVSACKKLSESS